MVNETLKRVLALLKIVHLENVVHVSDSKLENATALHEQSVVDKARSGRRIQLHILR
jgi:hypothetical protein